MVRMFRKCDITGRKQLYAVYKSSGRTKPGVFGWRGCETVITSTFYFVIGIDCFSLPMYI